MLGVYVTDDPLPSAPKVLEYQYPSDVADEVLAAYRERRVWSDAGGLPRYRILYTRITDPDPLDIRKLVAQVEEQ